MISLTELILDWWLSWTNLILDFGDVVEKGDDLLRGDGGQFESQPLVVGIRQQRSYPLIEPSETIKVLVVQQYVD